LAFDLLEIAIPSEIYGLMSKILIPAMVLILILKIKEREVTLEYENSDLFTMKLELKGDKNEDQRHLHLHSENNSELQLLEDPSQDHILRNNEVKNTVKTAVFKDELGHKLSPFSPNNNTVLNSSSKDKAPSRFSIQSSLNVCMPGPYQKFSAYAGDNVKVHGATYGHRDENLDEKYETMKRSPMKSPNKKRMKSGEKNLSKNL